MNSLVDTRDGREYRTIQIGSQIWMADNLAYIPESHTIEEECGIWVYDFLVLNKDVVRGSSIFKEFGCLYSLDQAMALCPAGWHLPGDDEWKELERFLGMSENELDEIDWRRSGNVGEKLRGQDVSESGFRGFNLVYGGCMWGDDGFFGQHGYAWFWADDDHGQQNAFYRGFHLAKSGIDRYYFPRSNGLSIRCVKDQIRSAPDRQAG